MWCMSYSHLVVYAVGCTNFRFLYILAASLFCLLSIIQRILIIIIIIRAAYYAVAATG